MFLTSLLEAGRNNLTNHATVHVLFCPVASQCAVAKGTRAHTSIQMTERISSPVDFFNFIAKEFLPVKELTLPHGIMRCDCVNGRLVLYTDASATSRQ